MRYRLFGRTCAKISEVGFGAWAIGASASGLEPRPSDDDEAIRALRLAYDMGCNLFDTGDAASDRGHAEAILAKALGPKRKGILLAMKVGGGGPTGDPRPVSRGDLAAALEQTLRRVGTDFVDLFQLHAPPADLLRGSEAIDALDEFKAEGKIRWAGVSVDRSDVASLAIESGRFEAIQIPFNLLNREMLHAVFPAAKRARVGVLVREPLALGLLTGRYEADHVFPPADRRSRISGATRAAGARLAKELSPLLGETTETLAQLAMKYVLAFDCVSSGVPGFRTCSQLEDLFEAGIGDPLDRNAFDAIASAIETRGEEGTL